METAMNSGSKRGPSLRRHKSSGHGYARFNGRQMWFGPFDDPATHARLAATKAEWEANGRRLPDEESSEASSVADLAALYLQHAETYYRRIDGSPTQELQILRYTVRPLLEAFGSLAASDFDLRRLKLLREGLIDSGLARKTVNDRIARVVRIFGWGRRRSSFPPRRSAGSEP